MTRHRRAVSEATDKLEEERDFLLRSLDDLELEHESGGIDDESYAELHDDYTARAAAAIRALRDGVDNRPEPAPPVPTKRRIAIVAGIVVFAVLAGVALAAALGARLPGQTASGNSDNTVVAGASKQELKARLTELEAKANANPNDYQTRLDLARAYEQNNDAVNALKQSDAAIKIDPKRPEAHANAGRLLYLSSQSASSDTDRNTLIASAKAGFDTAIAVGPDYADTYYFRGVLYAFALRDFARAQIDLQNYLVRAPSGPWSSPARTLLAQVTEQLTPSTTVVPPATTKKK
jgi:cytochrome c-type biogenesis protein CcmH/NrfG